VVEQLAPQRAHEPFGETVLPRRPGRDTELSNTEMLDSRVEHLAEDAVAVAEQPRYRRGVGTEHLHDLLLRRPRRVRVCRDVHVEAVTIASTPEILARSQPNVTGESLRPARYSG